MFRRQAVVHNWIVVSTKENPFARDHNTWKATCWNRLRYQSFPRVASLSPIKMEKLHQLICQIGSWYKANAPIWKTTYHEASNRTYNWIGDIIIKPARKYGLRFAYSLMELAQGRSCSIGRGHPVRIWNKIEKWRKEQFKLLMEEYEPKRIKYCLNLNRESLWIIVRIPTGQCWLNYHLGS